MTPERQSNFGERGDLVTPNDSADLEHPAYIRVGTAGNVEITTVGGDHFVVPNAQAGEVLPWLVKRVWAADTTASNLAATWNVQ